MRLSELLSNSGHCDVDIDGESIAVDYRTHFLTPEFEARLRNLGNSDEVTKEATSLLCGLVIRWDVQGDDGNMLPLEEDALLRAGFTGDLAARFMNTILDQGNAVGEAKSAV